MKWLLGAVILVVVGAVLRRLLHIDMPALPRPAGLVPLGEEREALYKPVAQEMETQAAILGISLNDAFEERDANRQDIAWHLVRLSASEWDRLAEIVVGLLNVLAKHLPNLRAAVPSRSIVASSFKSRLMIDHFRLQEFLDRLVFRSKLRFQLQLRVLRRAAEILTAEFRRTYRYAERTEDRPPELWNRLDLYFHDFDLVTKETLLAFRAFLVCLPHPALEKFASDLRTVVRTAVRSASVPADR